MAGKRIVEDAYTLLRKQVFPDNVVGTEGTIRWDKALTGELVLSVDYKTDPTAKVVVLKHGGVTQVLDYETVTLTSGGEMHYFTCPECGKRKMKLFMPPDEREFKCHDCHNLIHASTLTSRQLQTRLGQMSLAELQDYVQQADTDRLVDILTVLHRQIVPILISNKPWYEQLAELRYAKI